MAVGRRSRGLGSAIVASQLLTTAVAQTSTISLTLSSSVPASISEVVDIGFAGFGIEPSNLFSFTGGSDQNDLSINLLQNLGNYTGKLTFSSTTQFKDFRC